MSIARKKFSKEYKIQIRWDTVLLENVYCHLYYYLH
jgi:hypothetical protein